MVILPDEFGSVAFPVGGHECLDATIGEIRFENWLSGQFVGATP
jgi:hypothetical protein